jgi:hypothetical protein
MAAYLRRGGFLTIYHKNLSELFWSMSCSAFNEIHLETRLVERLNDLRLVYGTQLRFEKLEFR